MATTKIWSVKGNLGNVVAYAEAVDKTINPAFTAAEMQGLRDVMNYATQDYKTERQRFVSGIHCAPEIARQQMILTKERWGKEGGIVAFHGYQSFAHGEVTPEQAHKIGLELAEKLWGNKFEVIVATHLDKEHIHNHFVLNSVSFLDGKRYNDCKATYALMRATSDQLCREHGLSVIERPETGRTQSYDTWMAEKAGKPTLHGTLRADVDWAVAHAVNFTTFLEMLKRQGYQVKRGKYIAILPPGKERFVRLKTLGDGYTEEAIKEKLRNQEHMEPFQKPTPSTHRHYKLRGRPQKLTGLRALYYRYLYLLGKVRKQQTPRRVSRFLMDEVIKFDRHVAQAKLLQEYRIDTMGQLDMLTEAIADEMAALTDRRKPLYAKRRATPEYEAVSAEIGGINARLVKLRHDAQMCGQIVASVNDMGGRMQYQLCATTELLPRHVPVKPKQR